MEKEQSLEHLKIGTLSLQTMNSPLLFDLDRTLRFRVKLKHKILYFNKIFFISDLRGMGRVQLSRFPLKVKFCRF